MKKTRILAAVLVCVMLLATSAMLWSCGDKDEVLGKGKLSFKLEITDSKGDTKKYTIKTDEKTVADALMHEDVKMIPAGTAVNDFDTLNGIKADYTADGAYWGFYIDDEFATDSCFNIEPVKNAKYSFKYEIFDPSMWDDGDNADGGGEVQE